MMPVAQFARFTFVATACYGLASITACSGTSPDTHVPDAATVTCGPGTALVQGECVVVEAGAGGDATTPFDGPPLLDEAAPMRPS